MAKDFSVARELRRFMVKHPGRLNDSAAGRCLHCDAGITRHSDGIHRSLGWEIPCPKFDFGEDADHSRDHSKGAM